MGQTLRCDLCADEEAAVMLTSLVDGSTNTVGANCLASFVAGLAQTVGLVALPAETVPVEMGGTLELPGAGDVLMQGNDEPPKRKRGARKVVSDEPATDPVTDEPTDEPTDATPVDAGVTT